MPTTEVLFFKDGDETIPVLEWLNELRERNERAYLKCFDMIALLKQFGHELRRPRADILRDGVYELRTKVGKVHYRILYSFVGENVALLDGALTKEKEIPARDIDEAAKRAAMYKANPKKYGFSLDEENENG